MRFSVLSRSLVAGLAAVSLAAAPAVAQMQTVDPNSAIDADLAPDPYQAPPPSSNGDTYYDSAPAQDEPTSQPEPIAPPPAPAPSAGYAAAPAEGTKTFKRDDLIGAAEGVFGKGAKGLAQLIEKILKDQGEPTAYIAGREASAAFVVGLRYGSGTLFHTIEGQQPAYWTGPSIGFDAGGDAAKAFVLVYNLHDSHDLYQRFPAGEGNAYLVGGFTASYLRSGDIVLIPIRLGVGVRLGANIGYMKFSEKQNWIPF